MVDILKRSFVSFVGLIVIGYAVFLSIQGQIMVAATVQEYQYAVIVLALLVVAAITVCYGIYPIVLPRPKLTLLAVGIGLLFVGYYLFADDATVGIYMGDVMTLYGVLIILFGATGVIITKQIEQKKQEAAMEVIEV